MFIAKELKKQSISEYLLYMWQIEDLIRANELDIQKIGETVVDRYQLAEEQKQQLTDWFENLVEMMRHEGLEKRGHLQINKNLMLQLEELHVRLLHAAQYPYYQAAYYKALPFIVELRAKGESKEVSEIENCFDALYGVWMLKLQKRPIQKETTAAVKEIVTFIGLLSDYYQQDINGDLKFE